MKKKKEKRKKEKGKESDQRHVVKGVRAPDLGLHVG